MIIIEGGTVLTVDDADTVHFGGHLVIDGDRITAAGPGRYVAPGVLTIRGVAKPLTLPFTLAITGASAKMNAQVSLNRLAFGVGQGEWAATDTVPANVTVNIAIQAHRAP